MLAGQTDHGGRPAGADGGRDPGDHRRQPDQPLVPRDEVTSKQRIDGEFADEPPGRPAQRGAGAAAGSWPRPATATRSRSAAAAPTRHVTYVDGVPVRPGYRGDRPGRAPARTEIEVGTNAFEEASVTTGSTSAEFGNAQSGVISIATRTGGNKFTGYAGLRDR